MQSTGEESDSDWRAITVDPSTEISQEMGPAGDSASTLAAGDKPLVCTETLQGRRATTLCTGPSG